MSDVALLPRDLLVCLKSYRQRRQMGEWTNDDNDTGWLYTGLLARDRGKCHTVFILFM